jgi:glycosyltransferase involved in cell wall biosynthesis
MVKTVIDTSTGSGPAIHQFIPYLHAPGDAAADQVYAFQRAFRAWGLESQIYALEGDAEVAGLWRSASEYVSHKQGSADDVLLYHYVVGSPLTALLRTAPGRLILFYHNITPAEYVMPFHGELAASLHAGREEVRALRDVPALAPSQYSQRELVAMGFQQTAVVPLILDLDRLYASAQAPAGQALVERYADGWVNWVTVGRVAPNKRCEDVLKAFAYYRRFINPHSRLFFVGGYRHFEAYQFNLARLAERLEIADGVHWCGWVRYADGFGAYYRLASVFVYMSEHEGFCMPLLEAMGFDTPVIAYNAAAVPSTLKRAGILVNHKRYEAIAVLVDLLERDQSLRRRLIAGQRRHLDAFTPEKVNQQLRQAISDFLGVV